MAKKQDKKNWGVMARNILFWLLITLFVLVAIGLATPRDDLKSVPFSEVITEANAGELKKIEISGNDIKVTPDGKDKPTEKSYKEDGSSIYEQGLSHKADVVVEVKEPSSTSSTLWNLASLFLPILLIGGLFWFMFRQAQGQSNQALGFGRSKAKLYGSDKEKVKFDDIAGNHESKEDLYEVVDFLKHPKKYQSVGAKIPKGVLLVGAPGTGKTMLARAVAGEANVPYFSISGSEFVEMFVGVGASRVRDLFAKAKKNAPSIIFIDEIDAVGRKRGSGMGGGHDEREQTLNQILVEMDGFETGSNVIVIAATNRQDVLDPALLRPGRFDRRVQISLPEQRDREAILKVHFKNKPVDSSVDIKALASKSVGSSGADLANIANESAIVAARNNRKIINNDDVTLAFEKIAIGPERKTRIMSDADKEMTAYHEAGHALVGHVIPDSEPVHKVTIIPRGGTGGVTWFLPPDDKMYHSIVELKDVLARALGGRVAEKIIYGDDKVTTGASNDLQKATEVARDMIIEQGMGTKLRDQVFHENSGGMMFDRMVHERPYSDETAKEIDREVEGLMKEAAKRAEIIIKNNREPLKALTDALLKKETIDEKEIATILKGAVLPKEAALY
ncbi:ATP-dependent zinc metalloprotease FtsH [Candidatus Saccharibacteria bacterium]|nr:ATP-dependent zinc metalloprotease FtsH [Candidatus Saccharibacteria bacterium]